MDSLFRQDLDIPSMSVIFCKECKETVCLNPRDYWTIKDTQVKCERCGTINTITLVMGELKKQVYSESTR